MIVTVCEDDRGHGNFVADRPAGRMASSINLGRDVFDDDTRAAF